MNACSGSSPDTPSFTTLWATPSKEWVIPAKPKPGRKPKKEPSISAPPHSNDTDSKGRRVQNRAAQRAFRERKQMQLADLQARVQQYEQGEIERTVAIQSLAKRLKEDNDRLKAENRALKDRVDRLEEERDSNTETRKKRWREEHSQSVALKRPKICVPSHLPSTTSTGVLYTPSPSSHESTPESADSCSPFSPISLNTSPIDETPAPCSGPPFDLNHAWKSNLLDAGLTASSSSLECRFCSLADGSCVCAELALHQTLSSSLKVESADLSLLGTGTHLQGELSTSSILDNLPPYRPPVPLRRRSTLAVGNNSSSVFPIWIPTTSLDTSPTCSGDPTNCSACVDDDFGKAFCTAMVDSQSSNPHCQKCLGAPKASSSALSVNASAVADHLPNTSIEAQQPTERLPTNEAWRQLKSHPNVAFADLRLLAEVVARRAKCSGPTVEIVPAPGSVTPERALDSPVYQEQEQENMSIVLTDPHARYHAEQARRTSAPEVLLKCGCQDVRQVPAEGVRDALRLLDGSFDTPT